MKSLLWLHYVLRPETAFKDELKILPYEPLGDPIRQGVFYEPNLVSIIETCLTWVGKDKLIERQTESQKRTFSIRQLHGLWAGKAESETSYPDLLTYSQKLLPASGYLSSTRVGFETDEDFENNCRYVEKRRPHIAGTDDGEFRVFHRAWDNRYFLLNIDGAHHLAAVYRQCIEQGRDFTFEAYLEHHSLNGPACRGLIDNRYILLCTTPYANSLSRLLMQYGYGLPPIQCEYDTGKSLLDINRNLQKADMMYRAIVSTLSQSAYFDVSRWLNTVLENK